MNSERGIITIEQERAEKAWKVIEAVKGSHEITLKVKKKYRSYVRSAPTLIITNGLTQTLAFWKSKTDEKAYQILSKDISSLVLGNSEDLLSKSIKISNVDEYIKDTEETLAYLVWLKRFAESELPKED
jgi:CRISPR-associated protein Cmr5